MAGSDTTIPVLPVSVRSLQLPRDLEQKVAKIARREATPDLDTAAEFKEAAKLLDPILKGYQKVAQPKVGGQSRATEVVARWRDGRLHRFSPSWVPGHHPELKLTMHDLENGREQTVTQAMERGYCGGTFSRFYGLATDGTDVFALLGDNDLRSGPDIVGKVVEDGSGLKIKFAFDLPKGIQDLEVRDGKVVAPFTQPSAKGVVELTGISGWNSLGGLCDCSQFSDAAVMMGILCYNASTGAVQGQ